MFEYISNAHTHHVSFVLFIKLRVLLILKANGKSQMNATFFTFKIYDNDYFIDGIYCSTLLFTIRSI